MKIIKTNENILTMPIVADDKKFNLSDLDDKVFYDIDSSDTLDDTFELSESDATEIPETASLGIESAVATQLNALIIDEFEAIQGYNSAIVSFSSEPNCENVIKVLKDIVYEENVHVGQLQELLKTVSPNAVGIEKGNEETQEQIASSEEVQLTSLGAKDSFDDVIDFSNINDDIALTTASVPEDVAHPFMKVESFAGTIQPKTEQQNETLSGDDECSMLSVDDEM